ncbi:uncharacterized protein LOC106716425 [Papilio machaon]|uniref:uncharacterized protein LOC106716425 n=1 Tax=Papilio machaon TaxID=76193 RepID=UPI001E66533F|nr:uncharacterized protein LOC106716425 [Papilio machaon]
MYHPVRRNMKNLVISAIFVICIATPTLTDPRAFDVPFKRNDKKQEDTFDNNIIDFDDEYSIKLNKNYDTASWKNVDSKNKDSYRYTIVKDKLNIREKEFNQNQTDEVKNITQVTKSIEESTELSEFSVIPLELVSTTENILVSVVESTTEADLTVIPLSTTQRILPEFDIHQSVTLPVSTQPSEDYTPTTEHSDVTTKYNVNETNSTTTLTIEITSHSDNENVTLLDVIAAETIRNNNTKLEFDHKETKENDSTDKIDITTVTTEHETNFTSTTIESINRLDETTETTDSNEEEVPIFTELDTEGEEEKDIPEDYYDSKDVVPTTAPKTDALSVIFGFAGSVVESVVETVAERVVPNWIYDIYKRMQKQSEALEAEKLRSREENGGLGQFGRGILKSISSGISKPLSQLMAGVRDIGSLDSDRGFVGSLASGVTSVANVANSVVDAFKDRVQAIYPGTVWCGDGHSAAARSGELGLFFFTDTCCRQHDACKIYIRAGETKYGLTNTGLFTRSHCSCDMKFRDCLRRTNSLVSAQIGLTYFNVLGPQCFRKAHPIVKCVRRTRITGQKCEEYELDYTKPKMWQWFDSETF